MSTRDLPEQLVGHVLLSQSNNESITRFQHAEEIGRPSSAPPDLAASGDEPQVYFNISPNFFFILTIHRPPHSPLKTRFLMTKLTFTVPTILLITIVSNPRTCDFRLLF